MALKLLDIVRLPDFPQLVDQGYELSQRVYLIAGPSIFSVDFV